jgi:carbon-monoxide dehydrogenase small subunit
MQIDGKFVVKGKIQDVWNLVLEPGTLASCIPGAEKIESTDNKTYNCLVKQSVGPITVKLQFVVNLVEVTPPTFVKAVGRGEALGKLGTFGIDLTVHLSEQAAAGTCEIDYKADVSMVGKLATFGERIMRAKVKSVGDQFTQNLEKKLKAGCA